MITYSKDQISQALEALSVSVGDTILVHSSLMHLGSIENVALNDQAKIFIDTVLSYLGSEGTLAVPAGFWEYGGSGQVAYDTRTSGVARDLGVVPAHFVTRAATERSLNPHYAVAAIGAEAATLCGGETAVAFGAGSPWDRLLAQDVKILFFGVGLEALMLARYAEQTQGVPYLYNKLYDAPIYRQGRIQDLPVVTPVRYLHLDFTYDLSRLIKTLDDQGAIIRTKLGGSSGMMVRSKPAFSAMLAGFKTDLHYLLEAPPSYIRGEIPFDIVSL